MLGRPWLLLLLSLVSGSTVAAVASVATYNTTPSATAAVAPVVRIASVSLLLRLLPIEKEREKERLHYMCVSLLLLLLLVLLLSFLRQPSSQVPFSLNDGSVLIAVMSYNGGRFACATEIEIKMERVGRRMVILLNRLRQARVLQGYARKTQSALFCQIQKEKRKTV